MTSDLICFYEIFEFQKNTFLNFVTIVTSRRAAEKRRYRMRLKEFELVINVIVVAIVVRNVK